MVSFDILSPLEIRRSSSAPTILLQNVGVPTEASGLVDENAAVAQLVPAAQLCRAGGPACADRMSCTAGSKHFCMYFTYVLVGRDGKHYVGSTGDLDRRLNEHRSGHVHTTSRMLPVELVYYEACLSKQGAEKRERYLKTGFGRAYLKNRLDNHTPQ